MNCVVGRAAGADVADINGTSEVTGRVYVRYNSHLFTVRGPNRCLS